MLTENTISKLREIRLGTMAEAFREQLTNPEISSLSFEDRFGLLVDAEWTTRKNNTLARMIKKAQFADPSACIENISYLPQRHNILLMGATGCGKTYLACALGMAAVRKSYQVRYVRLPELLTDLAIARTTGTYSKVIEQYKKPALLILDEWLLYRLEESQARDLLEIAEGRYKKGSIIFCSQFGVKGWRDKIGSQIVADAICDRIVHDSYRVVIECRESMRKLFGIDKES